jgi:hypothetical protein
LERLTGRFGKISQPVLKDYPADLERLSGQLGKINQPIWKD